MFLGFHKFHSYGKSTWIFSHKLSQSIMNTQNNKKNAHLHIRGTSGPSRKKAGLTVEASVSVMITVLALLSVLLVFVAMKKQVALTRVMYETCEDAKIYTGIMDRGAAAAAVVLDSKARAASKGVGNAQFTATFKDGALYYSAGFKLKVPFFKLATEGIYLKKTLIIELYGGYSEDDYARYVYVTKYGTVYHESLSCRHLNITILSVSMDSLDTCRNKSGGKYKPCEYCIRGKASGVVYITPEGDRYHSNRDCRGLLRNIRKVKLADVIDTHAPCADCGHLANN